MGQGNSTQIACREAGISEQLRDELLNGEIFYSLKEAQIVIEQWRKHYNTIRPHSALNYRPPAPQTFAPLAHHLDEIMRTSFRRSYSPRLPPGPFHRVIKPSPRLRIWGSGVRIFPGAPFPHLDSIPERLVSVLVPIAFP
jgi:Integrase core domain